MELEVGEEGGINLPTTAVFSITKKVLICRQLSSFSWQFKTSCSIFFPLEEMENK